MLVPHNVGGLLCATVLVAPGAMTRLSVAQSPAPVPGAVSSKSVKSSLTWQISGIKHMFVNMCVRISCLLYQKSLEKENQLDLLLCILLTVYAHGEVSVDKNFCGYPGFST